MRKCPHCKAELTKIGVVSEYNQILDLETGEWNSDDSEVGDTLYCFCPDCGMKLPPRFNKIANEA